MQLSYENFKKRYLRQAEVLCRGIGQPELAEKLCETGFEAVVSKSEDFSNHRDVYVKLAEIVYSWDAPAELLAQRIYPKITIPSDKELRDEGFVRERVRRVQRLRKEKDLHVEDKIRLFVEDSTGRVAEVLGQWEDYLKRETLSEEVLLEKHEELKGYTIGNKEISIAIEKSS